MKWSRCRDDSKDQTIDDSSCSSDTRTCTNDDSRIYLLRTSPDLSLSSPFSMLPSRAQLVLTMWPSGMETVLPEWISGSHLQASCTYRHPFSTWTCSWSSSPWDPYQVRFLHRTDSTKVWALCILCQKLFHSRRCSIFSSTFSPPT